MRCSPKLPNMPLSNSLQAWLGHELEVRGIDSVIYTRYILNILQQDSSDADFPESELFPPSKKASMLGLTPSVSHPMGPRNPGASVASRDTPSVRVLGNKGNRAGKKLDKKKSASSGPGLSADERKKCAAVACLRSVSDEDSGIEGLVDELCMKLQEQSICEMSESTEKTSLPKYLDPESSDSVISTSPDDLAERYYAAFPALSDSGEETGNPVVAAPADVSWSSIAQKGSPFDDSNGEANEEMVNAIVTEVLEDADNQDDGRGIYSVSSEHDAQGRYHHAWSPRYKHNSRRSPSGSWQRCDSYFKPISALAPINDEVFEYNCRSYRGSSQERFDRRYTDFCQPTFMFSESPTAQDFTPWQTYHFEPLQGIQHTWREHSTSSRISLQEIFGTKEVSRIEPCKTLVVDGQLVRLCATSVNSNNLDRITNMSLKEAPMEELVAQNLWQEVEREQAELSPVVAEDPLTHEAEAKEGNDSGCEQSPKKLANDRSRNDDVNAESSEDDQASADTDVEDPVWYSGPVEQMASGSPAMSGARLYKRCSAGDSEPPSALITPTLNLLWEEVWDDRGLYIGARLKDESGSACDTLLDDDQLDYSLVKEIMELAETSSESEGDYVDMAGCSVRNAVAHECKGFKDVVRPGTLEQGLGEGALEQGLGEGARVMDGGKSPDRLEIFKALAGDDEMETPTCTCNSSGVSTPIKQQLFVNSENLLQELDISQYKGCVTPEITQNKVPDDRPVFFLDPSELNNNHSTSAKVSEHCVHPSRYCTYSNLLHSSFISSSTSSLSSPFSTSVSFMKPSDTFPLCTESLASLWNNSSTANSEALASLWRTTSKNTSDVNSLWAESSVLHSSDNIQISYGQESQALWPPSLPHHQFSSSSDWMLPLSSESNDIPTNKIDVQVPWLAKTSFSCSSFSVKTDAIWRDPPLKHPPKIWDINLSPKLDLDCPLDTFGSSIANYIFHVHDHGNTSVFHSDLVQGCITGSLCGVSQTTETDDVWTLPASECSEDEGICDHDENLCTIPYNPIQTMANSHSTDCFSSWFRSSNDVPVGSVMNKMTGSMKLLPSETSAFSTDSLPTRLPHLPHVQSEPSMSPRQPHHKWGQNKYRMVRVKHLYKPDCSILRHLGLASECEDEPARSKTPEHHFKPIASPMNAAVLEQDVSKSKNVAEHSYVILDGVTGAKKDDAVTLTNNCGTLDVLEERSSPSGSSRSTSGSLYQRYRGQETIDVSFIPRFKICRENKCIQTGEVSPWQLAAEAENDLNQEISERIVNEVLGMDNDSDQSSECGTFSDQNDEWDSICSQASEKGVGPSKVGFDGDSSPPDLAKFWGEELIPEIPLDTDEDPVEINMNTSSHDASIWSYSFDSMPDLMPDDPAVEEHQKQVETSKMFPLDSPSENLDGTLTDNFFEELIARSKEKTGDMSETTVSDICRYKMNKYCDQLIKDMEVLQKEHPLDQITKAVEISKSGLSRQKSQEHGWSIATTRETSTDSDRLLYPAPDGSDMTGHHGDTQGGEHDWALNNMDSIGRKKKSSWDADHVDKHPFFPQMTGEQWSEMEESDFHQVQSKQDNQVGDKKLCSCVEQPCQCGDSLYPDGAASVMLCEEGQCFRNSTSPILHGYQP